MSYRAYPATALGLLVVFALSFWWGGELKTLVDDRGRAAWDTANHSQNFKLPQGKLDRVFDTLATIILGNDLLRGVWTWLGKTLVPTLVAILGVLTLATTTIDRLAYQGRSALGLICEESKKIKDLEGYQPESLEFRLDSPCNPGGVRLTSGHYYQLILNKTPTKHDIDQDQPARWLDENHEANLAGLDRSQLSIKDKLFYFVMAPSFRRIFSEPWFKPMIRVGTKGFPELPVEPDIPFDAGSSRDSVRMTFRAPASGELFFFVNDAYAGIIPIGWLAGCRKYIRPANSYLYDRNWRFNTYCNNRGLVTGKISNATDAEILAIKGKK